MTDNQSRDRAAELHEQAMMLDDADAALALYREALAMDAQRPETHYNMGLIHKYRGEWQSSLDHNRLAVSMSPDDEAALWNLAIAGTALRQWSLVRDTWRQLGIRGIEPGDTPIELDFGMTPVRLNPETAGEVVWARRIDPVRARIENVPYPESGFRHGDVVLHDGAEVGQRTSGGQTYSVFNVLALFEPSERGTWVAELEAEDGQDAERAADRISEAGGYAEVWTRNVRVLCRQCSEGIPHEHHQQDEPANHDAVFRVGISAQEGEVIEPALRAWAAGRQVSWNLACAIAPSPRH